MGVIDAVDNWVVEEQGDVARLPSGDEWSRLKKSPLNGKIGMSFALQWRYNFGSLFRGQNQSRLAECHDDSCQHGVPNGRDLEHRFRPTRIL
jgi:hypothetical protein